MAKHKPNPAFPTHVTRSFPSDLYSPLEEVIQQKKVLSAGLLGKEVENYIDAKSRVLLHKG
jgi:hypothetical protein